MSTEYREDRAPPSHWQDFEDLCLKLWRPRLVDAKKNGRAGQPQAGVDIFGLDPKTETWWGIQCKQRGRWPKSELKGREIEEEIQRAEGFKPPLSHFIIATTAPRDAATQELVRQLRDWRLAAGKFSVDLYAWDDLQDWLQEGPEPISRDKAVWVWRQRILRLHSRLMPYFAPREDPAGDPRPFHQPSAPLLDHVYVELQLAPERWREGGLSGAGPSGFPSGTVPSAFGGEMPGYRLSIRQVLDLVYPWITRRWLLRGDPGSGKTTLLRHLAWTLAEAGGEPWVPVFESLPRLMASRLSVFGRIEDDLDRADQPGAEIRRVLEEEAGQGRLLLLLDGLDEVPREARDRAEMLLGELAARWPKSPIVAATQPIGAWSPGPEFLELEVLPFDAERRRGFLERWFGREGAPDRERAAEVAGVLEAERSLRELASNPLYLTLMALLIEGGEEPARYRSRLFDQIFDLLEEGRHHKPATPIDHRAVAHQGLCRLAYRMTEDNRDAEGVAELERRLLQDRELRELLAAAWPCLRDYLDDVAEKTGILGAHDGPEADWRFWHRSFREALTAERMAEALAARKTSAAPWLERLWQHLRGRGMPGLLRHARRIRRDDLGRWAEPYALLAGRVEEPDALIKALVETNRALGLRAVATAQGLRPETLAEVLELSGDWQERPKVYERLPELIDDPLRALALADQLRRRTRDGNDLFHLERAVAAVAEKWPDARRAADDLRRRLYDHVPPPPEELFRWIETPLDGRVELWRQIPAGRFRMGSPEDEEGRSDWEGPQHEVKISSPFRMAAVPVTVAQYAAFDPEHRPYQQAKLPEEELATHPVENATWYQAFAFCRWLSASLPWARGAQLPTEEEWEYACRAGTGGRYWCGDAESDLDRVGWYDANSGGRAHRVGGKPANPWGLYDIHGNVYEWTLPWTENYAGREDGIEVDPSAVDPADLAEPSVAARVVRGGSYRDPARVARSAYRDHADPGVGFWIGVWGQGFRVLLPGAPSDL